MSKKIIIGAISVLGIAIIGLVGYKLLNNSNSKTKEEKAEEIFQKFSDGLKELEIEYSEIYIDVKDFDVIAARMYKSGEKNVAIYCLDKNSKDYSKYEKDGYISSKKDSNLIVSGIVENGYLFYMEENFPKNVEVYELFNKITK